MRHALDDFPVGLGAGLVRLGPLVAGLLAGLIGFVVAPSSAAYGFFTTAAQVLPVVLLGLVFEGGIFGQPVRHQPEPHGPVVLLGNARRVLEFMTVGALLVGEWQAIHVAAGSHATGDPRLAYMGLTWGLVTVAFIAAAGRRPRVTAWIDWRPEGQRWIVKLGMANVYGDKEVEPLMNFLVPKPHGIYECDQAGDRLDQSGKQTVLRTTEPVDGKNIDFSYVGKRVLLTPGDAAVSYYSVSLKDEESERMPSTTPVILRLDHAELRRGRAEVFAWLDPAKPGQTTSPGTT